MANSNKTKLRFVDFYAITITGPKGVRQASRYLSLHSLRPPSSAHYSNLHMQQGYLDPFSVFFSAQVSWLPSLLSACARECASECYTSVLPMYSLLCSNITKLIFRGTVKLLMGSIGSIRMSVSICTYFLPRRFKLSFCFLLFRFPLRQRVSGSVEKLLCHKAVCFGNTWPLTSSFMSARYETGTV